MIHLHTRDTRVACYVRGPRLGSLSRLDGITDELQFVTCRTCLDVVREAQAAHDAPPAPTPGLLAFLSWASTNGSPMERLAADVLRAKAEAWVDTAGALERERATMPAMGTKSW